MVKSLHKLRSGKKHLAANVDSIRPCHCSTSEELIGEAKVSVLGPRFDQGIDFASFGCAYDSQESLSQH